MSTTVPRVRSALRTLAAPLGWTAFIATPAAGWGWLDGVPLGAIESCALALAWWVWSARRQLPGARLAAVFVVAKLALGGLFNDRGFEARYYANDTWSAPLERSVESRGSQVTRLDERLAFGAEGQLDLPLHYFNDLRFNFYLQTDPRRDSLAYSIEWRGWLQHRGAPAAATYYIETGPGIFASLAIDDRQVVDTARGPRGTITLQEGWHAVAIRVKAPYGASRRIEAGEIVDGAPRPFGPDRVFPQPVASLQRVTDTILTWITRLADSILLAWLTVLVFVEARHAWRARRPARLLFLAAIVEALIFASPFLGRMILFGGGDDWLLYESHARAIALGDIIGAGQPGPFYTQPFYPYFVALTHAGFGDGLFGAIFVQRLLLASTVGWIAALTTRLFGTQPGRIALVAGGVFLYIKIGPWTDFLLTEMLFLPLVAGWVTRLVLIADAPGVASASIAGVLGGVATLTRSTLLLGWPPALFFWGASLPARRARLLAAVLVPMMAIYGLIGVRNWIVVDQFITGPTNFGVSFLQGNDPGRPLAPAPADRVAAYDRLGLADPVRTVIEFGFQAPAEFALGFVRKALYTVGFFGWSRLPGGAGTSWLYVGIWACAIAGAIRIVRERRPEWRPIVWLPGGVALSHFAVSVLVLPWGYTDRYILPLYPLLIPYAAFAVEPLPAALRRLAVRLWPPLRAEWDRRAPGLVRAASAAARVVQPIAREPQYWLYGAYAAAAGQRLNWVAEDADETGLVTALLLPAAALVLARATRRERARRIAGAILIAAALTVVGIRGSLSPYAVNDPLLWGLVGAAALGVSALVRRRRAPALMAAAAAGAAVAIAVLLPVFRDFATNFPDLDRSTASRSLDTLSGQLGVWAVAFLFAIWFHAIAAGGGSTGHTARTGAAARGALLAALLLTLAGAVPTNDGILPAWIAALGALVGLAGAKARSHTL